MNQSFNKDAELGDALKLANKTNSDGTKQVAKTSSASAAATTGTSAPKGSQPQNKLPEVKQSALVNSTTAKP